MYVTCGSLCLLLLLLRRTCRQNRARPEAVTIKDSHTVYYVVRYVWLCVCKITAVYGGQGRAPLPEAVISSILL